MPSTRTRRCAFTLIEVLVGISVIAVLAVLVTAAASNSIEGAKTAHSQSTLKQLVVANLAYLADHGTYSPAQNLQNTKRWHGGRSNTGARFDPSEGYLSPYMRDGHYLTLCPLLEGYEDTSTFEAGAGGYGYNAAYIGGRSNGWGSWDYTNPNVPANVPRPVETIMFTTTAFAKGDGIQEYPYTEPPESVMPAGLPTTSLQGSTHFRATGNRAIVAWCDGHVTMEDMNSYSGPDYYGGDSEEERIGWFGPMEHNGYWNPKYAEMISR